MKNKSKIIFIILSVIILTPQLSFASWWNPFSWSKNSKQNIETIEPTLIQSVNESISVSDAISSKQKIDPKIIEKIVEKPITKTITVQDPTLQSKINTLIAENETLKAQVNKLLESNKSLNNELLSCEDKPISTFSVDGQCEYAREKLDDLQKEYTETSTEINKERDKIKENPLEADKKFRDIYNRSGLTAMLSSFNANASFKLKPILDGINSAKSAITLYCD